MKPAGIHHLAICVTDADAGLAFYRDVLGFTQLPRPDLGPGLLARRGRPAGAPDAVRRSPARDPIISRSASTTSTEAVADLEGRDVKVFTSDYIPGAGRQAFLHDPFGNFIELNQPETDG